MRIPEERSWHEKRSPFANRSQSILEEEDEALGKFELACSPRVAAWRVPPGRVIGFGVSPFRAAAVHQWSVFLAPFLDRKRTGKGHRLASCSWRLSEVLLVRTE